MNLSGFFQSVFFTGRLYGLLISNAVLYIAGFFYPLAYAIAAIFTFFIALFFILDCLFLYLPKRTLEAERKTPERLSNGDENTIFILIQNQFPFRLYLSIIDEIPFQFQKRDFLIRINVGRNEKKTLNYILRPVRRGEYSFGALNIFAKSAISLVSRRFTFSMDAVVAVYPSILQMKKYELLAVSNRLTEAGIKNIRRLGHTMEFDHISRYVSGDDYRTINWKATARKAEIMVNRYEDEKSQPVYCVIDMSRAMKMPFEGMSLLDYSINASLILSAMALYKQDKSGIIAFSNSVKAVLPAEKRGYQMQKILETLYRLDTEFKESDYEQLYSMMSRKLTQRSLIFLFTNFESLTSFKRNSMFFRQLGTKHILVVVFFKNTELEWLTNKKATSIEDIYVKTIAMEFEYQKRQIAKELGLSSAIPIITTPKELTAEVINRYLEIKARGIL